MGVYKLMPSGFICVGYVYRIVVNCVLSVYILLEYKEKVYMYGFDKGKIGVLFNTFGSLEEAKDSIQKSPSLVFLDSELIDLEESK